MEPADKVLSLPSQEALLHDAHGLPGASGTAE